MKCKARPRKRWAYPLRLRAFPEDGDVGEGRSQDVDRNKNLAPRADHGRVRSLQTVSVVCSHKSQGQLTQDWLTVFDLTYINEAMIGGLKRASGAIEEYCEKLAIKAFGLAQV